MNEKKNWFLFISVIVLLITFFFGGYFIARGRSNSEIREAQNTVNTLTETVKKLDSGLKIAESEISTLRSLQSRDRETINRLYQSNRTITGLVRKQGNIINELREQGTRIEESSSSIEIGLGQAIKSIDGIINFIQERKD